MTGDVVAERALAPHQGGAEARGMSRQARKKKEKAGPGADGWMWSVSCESACTRLCGAGGCGMGNTHTHASTKKIKVATHAFSTIISHVCVSVSVCVDNDERNLLQAPSVDLHFLGERVLFCVRVQARCMGRRLHANPAAVKSVGAKARWLVQSGGLFLVDSISHSVLLPPFDRDAITPQVSIRSVDPTLLHPSGSLTPCTRSLARSSIKPPQTTHP